MTTDFFSGVFAVVIRGKQNVQTNFLGSVCPTISSRSKLTTKGRNVPI